METKISNQPLIYYVIQGKSINQKGKVFDEKFIHDNPLIARKIAFDYFEYNIQLVKEQQKQQIDNKIKLHYILDDSNIFKVLQTEKDIENQGVVLYLVICITSIFENKKIQSEERFLLHVEHASSDDVVTEMKNALVREFGLYQYLNIDPGFNERVIKINFKSENDFLPVEKSIIKTPFDFKIADYNTSTINLFNRKILFLLKTIHHRKTSFIDVLEWHNIRIQMSSFLNTGSGYIFLGNIKNTNTISSVFEGKSLAEVTSIVNENISKYFPKHARFFSFEFITINDALIVIIVFKTFVTPCFYDNETNNNFYYRDKNGINVINTTAMIVSYLNLQTARHKDSIQEIIDAL
jgi:hypothetical protein